MISTTFVRSASLLSALFSLKVQAGASGTGSTTRYWDCCKPSCAWSGKADVSAPVGICDISDNPLSNSEAASGCTGGTAYMCSSQAPWAVNSTLAYGFAAVNIAGGSESSWCSACYALKFTSGTVAGKTLIVQATNTGGDLGSNQFDLAIPGGGVGIYNGCTAEWGAPSSGWGAQYGGISSASGCDTFPSALKPGCDWRYDWFEGADNPTVEFEQVACPAEIIAKTGSKRTDDSSMPDVVGAVVASSPAATSAAVVASTSKAPISSAATSTPTSTSTPIVKAVVSTPSSLSTAIVAATTSSTSVAAVVAISSTPSSSFATVVSTVNKSACKAKTSASAASNVSAAALYAQCGGSGWTGPTTCVSGATCKVQNDWYSQCV